MWPSALQMRTTYPSEMLFKFCQMTLPQIAKQSILHSHLPNRLSLNYEASKNIASIKMKRSLQYLCRARSTEGKNPRKSNLQRE